MVRWEPGATERLQTAALELYSARGFEQTTAADIAGSVGLTERTFFRHFADKREVIFHGQADFERAFLEGVRGAPPNATALDVVSAALKAAATIFPDERRDYARLRQSIIVTNPSLQERELLKLASLSSGVAAALREHGIAEPRATLAAESCVTVFSVSFRRWIAEGETQSLADIEQDVLAELSSAMHPLRRITGSSPDRGGVPLTG